MLINQPHNPADFFSYVDNGNGPPLWVYVDTDIMDVPDGTLGLSFTLENSVGNRSTNDIWCFQEALEVAQWHNYFRRPEWPSNVFRSLQDETFVVTRAPGPEGPDDPPPELLDEVAELYYYKVDFDYDSSEVTDTSIWPRNPHTPFQNFCAPHLRGPRAFTIERTQWKRPVSLSKTLDAINRGSNTLPIWVFCSPAECDFVEDTLSDGILYLSNTGNENAAELTHRSVGGEPRDYCIPYYRQYGWPAGLFRLIDSYRHEGEATQVPSDIIGEQIGQHSDLVAPARLGIDYVRNVDLVHASDISAHIVRSRAVVHSTQEWWFWDWDDHGFDNIEAGSFHFARLPGRRESHFEHEAGFANRAGGTGADLPGNRDPALEITHSLYRHERWPENVFSNAWTPDGEPVYGPDAMGRGYDEAEAGSPDTSSFENPITDPDEFSYQTWVKFSSWQPTNGCHQQGRTVWIAQDNVNSAGFFPTSPDEHPFQGWGNSHKGYEAAYYRRRHFPEGVYRRLDRMRLVGHGSSGITRLGHDDEPPLSECGAPWHSNFLRDWVTAMEDEIGRPIFSDPLQGAPWIRLWSPQETEDLTREFNALLDGNYVVLRPGRVPHHPIGFEEDLLGHLDCEDGHTFASKFRTGMDFHFDPCSARYTSRTSRTAEAPEHGLQLLLEKIAPFFREYKDPDVVTDLAASLYSRVASKKDAFAGDISDKKRAIGRAQAQLNELVGSLGQVYETMAYYDTMSEGKYKATLEAHLDLITQHGTLKHRNNTLTLTLNEFEIQDQPLGPMNIRLVWDDRRTFRVTVHPVSGCENKSQQGYVHPHVSNGDDGQICWGSGGHMAQALATGIDPLEFIFATAMFLKTGYQAGDAYCRIGNWLPVRTWFCDPCGDDHVEGQDCPYICQSCTLRVHWDEHGLCDQHNACWSFDDRETCPVCAGETETGDAHNTAAGETSAAE